MSFIRKHPILAMLIFVVLLATVLVAISLLTGALPFLAPVISAVANALGAAHIFLLGAGASNIFVQFVAAVLLFVGSFCLGYISKPWIPEVCSFVCVFPLTLLFMALEPITVLAVLSMIAVNVVVYLFFKIMQSHLETKTHRFDQCATAGLYRNPETDSMTSARSAELYHTNPNKPPMEPESQGFWYAVGAFFYFHDWGVVKSEKAGSPEAEKPGEAGELDADPSLGDGANPPPGSESIRRGSQSGSQIPLPGGSTEGADTQLNDSSPTSPGLANRNFDGEDDID